VSAKEITMATATKAIKIKLNLRHEPIAFNSPERAKGFAGRCDCAMWVVLGDCPTAWVVCPADAAKLERAGYEIA